VLYPALFDVDSFHGDVKLTESAPDFVLLKLWTQSKKLKSLCMCLIILTCKDFSTTDALHKWSFSAVIKPMIFDFWGFNKILAMVAVGGELTLIFNVVLHD
jgi:hypothetical protein